MACACWRPRWRATRRVRSERHRASVHTARRKAMSNAAAKREVVIVGAGIAGVAAFIGAVRSRSVSRVDIVDPRGVGNGIAFATTEPALLCNTSVETMSLLDD